MRRTSMRTAATAGSLAFLLSLAACSTGSTAADETPEAATAADAGAFPVTIEHAFGSTEIEEEPKRVVTIGWTDQDHVLALGVVPVGATKFTWGGNRSGSSDWFDAELEEMGGEAPTRFADQDGVPVAEIAKLDPDLVLATNSGITEEEYQKLSEIADVVAYPEAPWITPWRTSLSTAGEALGRSDRAEELLEETETALAGVAEDHPQLEGTSFVFTFLNPGDFSALGLYGRSDPRVAILEDMGLVSAPIVEETVPAEEFFGSVSAERADTVESDILLGYAEAEGDLEMLAGHRLLGQVPALQEGRAYLEVDKHVGLAITNPTPLSVPYVIEKFVPEVAEVADAP